MCCGIAAWKHCKWRHVMRASAHVCLLRNVIRCMRRGRVLFPCTHLPGQETSHNLQEGRGLERGRDEAQIVLFEPNFTEQHHLTEPSVKYLGNFTLLLAIAAVYTQPTHPGSRSPMVISQRQHDPVFDYNSRNLICIRTSEGKKI